MQTIGYIFFAFIIIVFIALYFLYNDISNVKKLSASMFRKTIALESKVTKLEKNVEVLKHGDGLSGNDSPIMELSYKSDAIPRKNNGINYALVSNSEAEKIKNSINGGSVSLLYPVENNGNTSERKISNYPSELPSDFAIDSEGTSFDVDLSSAIREADRVNSSESVSEVLKSLEQYNSSEVNSEMKKNKISKKVMRQITNRISKH